MVGARRLSQTLRNFGADGSRLRISAEPKPCWKIPRAALREVEAQLAEQVGPAVLPAEGSAA